MFDVRRDWLSERIIYPTRASYPVKWGINESHLGGEIILSYPDGIK